MTKLDDINRLAEIKSIIKTLTDEASLIQASLLEDPDCPKRIKTQYGKLVQGSRTTYENRDKEAVIKEIGIENFIAAANVTLPAVKKVCGTAVADVLLLDGAFKLKSVSRYFSLRQ